MKTYIIENLISKEQKELNCTWDLKQGNLYEFLSLEGWYRVIGIK
jgi:hypothetical protein